MQSLIWFLLAVSDVVIAVVLALMIYVGFASVVVVLISILTVISITVVS